MVLLQAVKDGDAVAVERMLMSGSRPNAVNPHGDTALILASWYGHETTTGALLTARADVTTRNADGNSALNCGAYQGFERVVALLLRHGAAADVGDAVTGKTALIKAAYLGHEPVARVLLDASAQVDTADAQGYTALAFAASFNHAQVIQLLLSRRANPDTQDGFGITPLVHAAARGFVHATQMLLRAGATPGLADFEGRSAVEYADAAGFDEVAAELRRSVAARDQQTPRALLAGDVYLPPRVPLGTNGGSGGGHSGSGNGGDRLPNMADLRLTLEQVAALDRATLCALLHKLMRLTRRLEQVTVQDDARYPSFGRPEALLRPSPPPGWTHCEDGGFVRLRDEDDIYCTPRRRDSSDGLRVYRG